MWEQLRKDLENNPKQQEGSENNRLIPILEKQPEAIKKMEQVTKWEWKETTIKQCVYVSKNWKKVNASMCLRTWKDPIIFSSYAPTNNEWKTIPAEINPIEKEEYKPKKVILWENNLVLEQNEQTLENAEKIMQEFLQEFQTRLQKGVEILEINEKAKENMEINMWDEDFTKPVVRDLFRDYTIFKGTVFGKNGTGLNYANTYFSHFIEKKPIKVELNQIKDFAFTKDGLTAVWDYTFTTKDWQEILWSFFMLIWRDKKWYHFKTFHSAARDSVIG